MSILFKQLEILKQSLRRLGMSPNAIKLFSENYLTGKTSIGKLARQTKMDRSSAYLAFRQLKERGLVIEDVHKRVKQIQTVSPRTVISILKKELSRMDMGIKAIEHELPKLMTLHGVHKDAAVLQAFSGTDTLRKITNDILTSHDREVRIVTNQKAERRVFSAKDHDDFIRARVRHSIKAIVLAADTPEVALLKRYDKRELRETRVRKDLKPFKSETYIYGSKVAILSYEKDIFGFIMHAKEFADLQRYMFDKIWKATNQ